MDIGHYPLRQENSMGIGHNALRWSHALRLSLGHKAPQPEVSEDSRDDLALVNEGDDAISVEA